MKNLGIHVLDFNDKIIDYISRDDGALIHAVMSNNAEEKSETFDFTVVNKRADKLRERNRIIAQDNNGTYREFVISHVVDNFDGTTDIESNASYLEDIDKSKPIKPGKYSAYSTSQALNETLRNTGWELSEDTEHGGMRTTSWTSYSTPYEVINMLCTTYDMVADYSIELGSHTVEHRYVTLKQPVSLFKGKEITKGKDLTEMTRTVDMSEVRTALYAIGPENDKGERISVVVKDDEAQAQFGLPGRYLWNVYEPESDDSSMTEERLTTLAQTELNKRNQSAISYEISSIDIHKHYPEMVVSMHDTVRIKDRDFRPPLYIEAEVIGVDYDLILDESTYKFGNVVEYDESSLRSVFDKKIDEIRKKLNDNVTNINTIVNDAIEGELEYYERKIIKSDTAPDNPVEDMLWYDTSNPNVAVLKRYHNGEWLNETAKDVEQLGGMTREHVLYNSITNTFQNLNIQHSKLLEEVSSLLNNEYLVDSDIRNALNNAQDNLVGVYQQIKDNLDSMNEDTATIGKLIDTQALFLTYRERLQDLYRAMRDAQVSADKRLKLLQSQYTDEKFNDAMDEVARALPNGHWDSEKGQLTADFPNGEELEKLRQSLQEYTEGKISDLKDVVGKEIDSRINNTKEEISAHIGTVERKIDGLEVGGRNLLENSANIKKSLDDETDGLNQLFRLDITHIHDKVKLGDDITISFDVQMQKGEYLRVYDTNENYDFMLGYVQLNDIGTDKQRLKLNYKLTQATRKSDKWLLDFYNNNKADDKFTIENIKIEKGTVATDWTTAPEDVEVLIDEAKNAAQSYAEAQDKLKQTETKAYADGIVTKEEQRAINDAIAKRDEAKAYAEQMAQNAEKAAKTNASQLIEPITTRVTSTESDISVLKDEIQLMAKSDEVSEKLKSIDGRLEPIEKDVKSNKATLDVLPDQINSKVSNQDYTTDQNNLITRLNNADSERKQLSNSISEKVSLTEYNSGINSVKSYTDNKVNNINVGGRNLFLSYNKDLAGKVAPQITSTGKFTTQNLWATSLYEPDYFRTYLEPNTTYTISYEMAIKNFNGIKTISGKTFGLLLYDYTERKTIETFTIMALNPTPDTSLIDKKYKFTKTFTTPSDFKNDYKILGYSGYGDDINNTRQYVTAEITNLKLEKGTMATDWTPATEDVNSSISNASADTLAKANNYTDNKNNEVQKTLTKMDTDISQNGKDIQLRATKQEFNSTNKTLSKTISDFTNNVATGMTFTYDENGTIQSMNIGSDGIKLRGDKVDITVNKDFNVVAQNLNDKVGKDEVINRLNLSPEGLDIDVNKVGIRGGDNTNYIYLSQDKIEMAGTFQRTFRGNTQKDNVFMRAQGGYLRFRNNPQDRSLYLSDFGLSTYIDGNREESSGTLQFFDYTYSTARGVTLNSAMGVVALRSDQNRVILDANYTVNIESSTSSIYMRPMKDTRKGNNEFRFFTKLNDTAADTDGVLSYGAQTHDEDNTSNVPKDFSFGSGIRFDKSPKTNFVYATNMNGDIGTGDFYGGRLFGDWQAKNNNVYAMVDPSEGKLRITDYAGYNGGDPKYRDLQCHYIQADSIRLNSNKNFYIGVSTGELWVTNNLLWNGGDYGLKPVRASDFIKGSSAELKKEINEWNYDALSVIADELQMYSYKYKDDEQETIHHGPVIGDNYNIPVEFVFGNGVNTNEMLSWALRAIQQLNEKVKVLEEQNNGK